MIIFNRWHSETIIFALNTTPFLAFHGNSFKRVLKFQQQKPNSSNHTARKATDYQDKYRSILPNKAVLKVITFVIQFFLPGGV